jgi:hypothetical protein
MRPLRRLFALAALAWSAWFLVAAFERWRFEVICSKTCGPFWPVELVEELRRAMDWQSPLLAALLPLVLVVLWMAFRLSTRRLSRS